MNTNNGEQVSGETIRHPDVSYERRDLSPRPVVGFFVSLAVIGVILHFVLWGLYKSLAKEQFRPSATTRTMETRSTQQQQLQEIGGDPAVKFPAPRLQPDPVLDYNEFIKRQESTLNTYGWVDQKAGKVHIPIERAIDVLAGSGLPVRQTAGAKSPGAPSESKPGASVSGKEPAGRK